MATKYNNEEILQYVNEEDVKFIRLAFCDIYGKQKNVSIMPAELPRAFKYGIAIDASSICGYEADIHSDLFLHPDPDTLALLPWRPEHGRVVRMFCTITYPDGSPFKLGSRTLLISAINKAAKKGLRFYFGSELEFYLFNTDEEGNPTKTPYDQAGYMDISPDDKGENIRREICLTLEKMGIIPESSHHEEGPGQNEIDYRYSDALSAADNTITLKNVVTTVAARNGVYADFSPKPLTHRPGNGFHVNVSLKGDEDLPYLDYIVAGLMKHVSEMTLFLNPSEDSYKRLGNNKAPKYISWSKENRSQLIRIPAAQGEYKRVELRSPDPEANPYLIFALIIHATLEAMDEKLTPPEPVDLNLLAATTNIPEGVNKLPTSLKEARELAKNSKFIASVLPQEIIDYYCS